MPDNYVDLYSAIIQRAAASATNAVGGVKGRALEQASRSSVAGGVPGNVEYDADGEPPSRFRFGGPLGLPFA